MYQPSQFRFDDRQAQLDFIQSHSFAELVTTYQGDLQINQFPFLVDESGEYLLTHLAKANNQWQILEKADDLKVCFRGPNAYISPNWYTNNNNVPTWNYLSVQVSGSAVLMNDQQLLELLARLSQKHEAQFATPWKIEKLSESQLQAMLKAIVGVKISIESVCAKAKLSQNKSTKERTSLMQGLAAQTDDGSQQILRWMNKFNLAE